MDVQAGRVTPPSGEDLLKFSRWMYRKTWKRMQFGQFEEEDMVQEGLAYLLKHFHKWDPTRGAWTTFAQWYLRCAWRKAAKTDSRDLIFERPESVQAHEIEKRYSVRLRGWTRQHYYGIKGLLAPEPDPEPEYTWQDALATESLTEYQATVATLVSKGMTQPEIGKQLGCTPEAAGQTWRTAFKKMRRAHALAS